MITFLILCRVYTNKSIFSRLLLRFSCCGGEIVVAKKTPYTLRHAQELQFGETSDVVVVAAVFFRYALRNEHERKKQGKKLSSIYTLWQDADRMVPLLVGLHNNLKMSHVTQQWAAEISHGTCFNPTHIDFVLKFLLFFFGYSVWTMFAFNCWLMSRM